MADVGGEFRDAGGRVPTLVWFWVCALIVLAADLLTKARVIDTMTIGGAHIEVLGEFFRLRHIRNSGGLFGLFPGNAIYFALVSAVAVVAILWVVYRTRERDRLKQVALGLVFGGALGNFHDRIRYQEVVDFLDVGLGVHRWPTFNVADAGVSVGVSLLILWLFVSERRRARQATEHVQTAGETHTRAADGTP